MYTYRENIPRNSYTCTRSTPTAPTRLWPRRPWEYEPVPSALKTDLTRQDRNDYHEMATPIPGRSLISLTRSEICTTTTRLALNRPPSPYPVQQAVLPRRVRFQEVVFVIPPAETYQDDSEEDGTTEDSPSDDSDVFHNAAEDTG